MKKTFQWRDSFETGHPVIDEQHRGLVECLQAIPELHAEQKGAEALEQCKTFRELLDRHFAEEEDILEEAKFPRLAEHLASHKDTRDRIHKVFTECGEVCTKPGEIPCVDNLAFFLFDHFLRGDLDFKSFLQTRNLTGDPS